MTGSNRKTYQLNAATGVISTIVASVLGFVSLPMSLHYWNTERYGLMAIVASLIVYLGVANLGVNTAAGVIVAQKNSLDEKLIVMKRAAYIVVASSLLALLAFVILSSLFPDWVKLLGRLNPDDLVESADYVRISVIFGLVAIPFSLLSSALQGFQRQHVDNLFNIAGAVLSFAALLATIEFSLGLVSFALLSGGLMVALNTAKSFAVLSVLRAEKKRFAGAGNLGSENQNGTWLDVLRSGLGFLSFFLASVVVLNSDNLVISHFIGVEAVTAYSVTNRLYQIQAAFLFILVTSAVSLFGKEFGSKNWEWINSNYVVLLSITYVAGGLVWVGSVFLMPDVVHFWTHSAVEADIMVVFFLGGYVYLLGVVNLNSVLMNAFNFSQRIPYLPWVEAVLRLTFAIVFVTWNGVAGLALAGFLASLLTGVWLLPVFLQKFSHGQFRVPLTGLVRHGFLTLLPLLTFGLVVQLYVRDSVIRILLGLLGVCIYILVSWFMISPENRVAIVARTLKRG